MAICWTTRPFPRRATAASATPTCCVSCMAEGLVGGQGFAVHASMIVADAHRQRGVDTLAQLDPKANRAVAEYFAALDDAASAALRRSSRSSSPIDPVARWTASWGGPALYAYCTNYLIDVEHAVIVDV